MNTDNENDILTENERRELAETQQAFRDVYGSDTMPVKTDCTGSKMSRALEKFQLALSRITGNQRKAYDEAVKRCPQLVDRESNPKHFLMSLGLDPHAAARGICIYWEKREEIFKERAFLPMDTTGLGAISKHEVKAMKCGATTILPPDSRNRPILCCDRSRYSTECEDAETSLKITFHALQMLLETNLACTNGYVMLTVLDYFKQGKKCNTLTKGFVSLLQSGAFPMTLRAFHVVGFEKQYLIETCAPIWMKSLESWKFLRLRSILYFAKSKEAMLHHLKQFRLLGERLPVELGGTLNWEKNFSGWFEESCSRKTCESSQLDNSDPTDHKAALETLAEAAAHARSDECKTRKRRLDVLYQRRKRQQRKQENVDMVRDAQTLKIANEELKRENVLLESLMKQAQQIARTHDQIISEQTNDRIPETSTTGDKPTYKQAGLLYHEPADTGKMDGPLPTSMGLEKLSGVIHDRLNTTPSSESSSLNDLLERLVSRVLQKQEERQMTPTTGSQPTLYQNQQQLQQDPLVAAIERLVYEARISNAIMLRQQQEQRLRADMTAFLHGSLARN